MDYYSIHAEARLVEKCLEPGRRQLLQTQPYWGLVGKKNCTNSNSSSSSSRRKKKNIMITIIAIVGNKGIQHIPLLRTKPPVSSLSSGVQEEKSPT